MKSDAIAKLLTAAELPVEDLDVVMLDAFVVATEGGERVGEVALGVRLERATTAARGRREVLLAGTRREPRGNHRGRGTRS